MIPILTIPRTIHSDFLDYMSAPRYPGIYIEDNVPDNDRHTSLITGLTAQNSMRLHISEKIFVTCDVKHTKVNKVKTPDYIKTMQRKVRIVLPPNKVMKSKRDYNRIREKYVACDTSSERSQNV
jgi:hypothetical protein